MTPAEKYDHHDYGLIRVSAREYVRCTGECCKSGGPAFDDFGVKDADSN